jgi:flagellar hook-associated protein FlgK
LASNLSLAISDPRAIAAAEPSRTATAPGNTGNAVITNGTVTDAAAYVPDDYSILLGADSGAATAGRGVFTDNNADSVLGYDLRINGSLVYTQNEAAAPLADLNALAVAINGIGDANVVTTGVRAYTDNVNLYLVNDPATALPINVTETLNTSAGTLEDADTFTGYFGSALTGVTTPGNSLNFASQADSYVVLDGSGAVVADGAYASANPISFNGIDTVISGVANLGDRFSIGRNIGGVGDNRNMLSLVGLQTRNTMDNGKASYLDVYGRMVATVGAKTQQAGITRDAQQILLDQSIAAREETSGVNLDEEAANLIRFQQAYQAAAQVISTANDLFQTLINAVGR